MDAEELSATLRAMRRVAGDEGLPAYLRELAEPFVESLSSIFERADVAPAAPKRPDPREMLRASGAALNRVEGEIRSEMGMPPRPGSDNQQPSGSQWTAEEQAILAARSAAEEIADVARPYVTIEQHGAAFVVKGDETMAQMIRALLAAAAEKEVGPMSARVFAVALEMASRGL